VATEFSPDDALVSESERRGALRSALATEPGGLASQADVRGLLHYTEVCGVPWDAFRAPRSDGAALVMLRLPGRVGVLLLSPPSAGAPHAATVELLSRAVCRAAAMNLNYLQALVEPEDSARRGALAVAGFRHLTQLVYLDRGATYPWVEPPSGDWARWIAYSSATVPRFEAVLVKSYDATLDCPELSGRRTTAEILAAHRASGAFDGALWEIAEIGGRDAGCVLMHRVLGSDALEVAYMGVAPEFRRQGVGGVLLRRALEKTRACGCARLKLVVDSRNAPARSLYDRFAFRAIARREAYLRFINDE
jgi:ribosomal protein S18 acetylase RimI-like enzyme